MNFTSKITKVGEFSKFELLLNDFPLFSFIIDSLLHKDILDLFINDKTLVLYDDFAHRLVLRKSLDYYEFVDSSPYGIHFQIPINENTTNALRLLLELSNN